MQKLTLSFVIFFALLSKTFAQCPVAGFSLPDSSCAGDILNFSNTSTNATSYQWDFCTGDLDSLPLAPVSLFDGGISGLSKITVVTDSSKYFVFATNFLGNTLYRLNLENDINNINPVSSALTVPNAVDMNSLDLIKEGDIWHGITSNYSGQVFRIDFNTGLNGQPDGTALTFGSGLNGPLGVKLLTFNGNYYAYFVNFNDNTLSCYNFGNSILNNSPTLLYNVTIPNANNSWDIDILQYCGAITGFISSISSGNIIRADFGSDPTVAPAFTDIGTFGFASTSGLAIATEGNKKYLFLSDRGTGILQRLNFGTNIQSTPTVTPFANITNTEARGICMFRDSSLFNLFSIGYTSSNISRISFPNACPVSESFSTLTSPSFAINTPGTQYITLTAQDSAGNFSTLSDSVYIGAKPFAGFTMSAACLNQSVAFTDTSTIELGSITQWNWDFGDGNTSNSQNPLNNYTNDSTYAVTLTVATDIGCSSTITDSVKVHQLPVAGFSFIDNQCSQTDVLLNDLTTVSSGDAVTAWEWNFGDATPLVFVQNPVHAFDTAGVYSIQLVAFSDAGCSDTITQSITIKPAPVADFSVSQTCVGETVVFTNNTTITGSGTISYEWDFGDTFTSLQTNPTHAYSNVPANYPVQLIATSTNNCKDTVELNLRISSKANPGFVSSPLLACIGNAVQFIDTSTIAAGDSIITSMWDFGDTNSATGDTVTHTYLTSGTFNVTLTVTSLTSCDTFITKTVTVIESPVAAFNFTSVCLDSTMYFADISTSPTGTVIDSVAWDFGDGGTAYGATASHVYADAGDYIVTQTVFNDLGCSGTATQTVTVYDKPIASFSTDFACSGTAVNFTNLSFIPNGTITSYAWDFGDTQTSVLENPSNVYTIADVYLVTLTVYSSQGCPGSVSSSVSVNAGPNFDYTDSLHCFGDTTYFRYISLVLPDPSSQWVWNFGDGTSNSPLVNPKHKYSNAGNYSVCLTVTAINTCARTICKNITVNPKPNAGIIAATESCISTPVSFADNSSIDSPGAITQWIWNFGDSSPIDNNTNSSHTYTTENSYSVTHIVVSDAGCSDTVSQNITIQALPIAAFTSDPSFGSPPLEVNFLNGTTGGASYQWDFGDGSTPETGDSPTHLYNDTGEYVVTMIATNILGCTSIATGTVSVLIPFFDLAIKDIHATEINDLLSISANLANQGNITVKKFQISTRTENGSPINEQWSSATGIKPGQTFTYTFNARYEVDHLNLPSFYCVEIGEINDGQDSVESNNRKCAALNEPFELFDIYPNPTLNTISIGANVPLAGTIELSIYNETGALIQRTSDIEVTKGYNEFTESIGTFAKGFYAVVVRYGDQLLAKKVMRK